DDAVAAALGAGAVTREERGVVDGHDADLELVDVGAVVVLGVGDRGLEHLVHEARGLLPAERENLERMTHGLAADLVGDEPTLLRRDSGVAQFGCYLHRLRPRTLLRRRCRLPVARVAAESPRDRELAELVADHVLRNQ